MKLPDIHGEFVFWPGTPHEARIPNIVTDEGEQKYLEMLVRGDALGGTDGHFYVGLCGLAIAESDTLASLAGEPTAAGGYARQQITRDGTGWPTIAQVGSAYRAQSTVETFAASGADFSTSVWRAFLCNVVSGSAGLLLAYSGALPNAVLVTDGNNLPIRYDLYLR